MLRGTGLGERNMSLFLVTLNVDSRTFKMCYQVRCLIQSLELKGEVWIGDKTDVLKHEKWFFLDDKLLYLLFYSLYFSAFLMFLAMKNNFFLFFF